MSRTLTEVSSDVATEEDVDSDVDSIVSKASVDMPDLYLHTLSGEKLRIDDITGLIGTNAKEFLEEKTDNIYIPQEVISQVRQLQSAIIYAWDKDIQKFRVEPRVHTDGNISELYVPLESKLTNDVTVTKVQDEDGINEVLKEELNTELYKIETMNLRVDKRILSEEADRIYQKKSKSFSDSYTELSEHNADIKKDIYAVSILSAFLLPLGGGYYLALQNMTPSPVLLIFSLIFLISMILWIVWGGILCGMVSTSVKAKIFGEDYKYQKVADLS